MDFRLKQYLLPFLSLFTSIGTLLCCALPALLVSLGLGATLAGLVSTVPQIVWVSEHKSGVFVVGGLLLLCAGASRYYSRNAPCPADPALAKACQRARLFGGVAFWLAVSLYCIGFFFAYLAADLL